MPESELHAGSRIAPREGVIAERLLDETIILDPESDAYARLNPTGRFLWERLARGATLGALAAELETSFELDRSRASSDVSDFVRALLARRLVELA